MKRIELGSVELRPGPDGQKPCVPVKEILLAWFDTAPSGIPGMVQMERCCAVVRKLLGANGAQHVDFEDAEHDELSSRVMAAPKPRADEAFLEIMRRVRDAKAPE